MIFLIGLLNCVSVLFNRALAYWPYQRGGRRVLGQKWRPSEQAMALTTSNTCRARAELVFVADAILLALGLAFGQTFLQQVGKLLRGTLNQGSFECQGGGLHHLGDHEVTHKPVNAFSEYGWQHQPGLTVEAINFSRYETCVTHRTERVPVLNYLGTFINNETTVIANGVAQYELGKSGWKKLAMGIPKNFERATSG